MCLPLYGPNVYVDKMKELVECLYFLMDIVTLLDDNWQVFFNECGRWLFLEVNLYHFYSLGSCLLVVGQS